MKRKDNRYVPKFGMSEKNAHGNTCDGLMLQKKPMIICSLLKRIVVCVPKESYEKWSWAAVAPYQC